MFDIPTYLHNNLSHISQSSIKLSNQGMDCFVFKAESAQWGSIAIKVPRALRFSNDNDITITSDKIIKQEFEMLCWLEKYNIKVPKPLFYDENQGSFSVLITEYIEYDQSKLERDKFKTLLDEIYDLPIPSIDLIAMEGMDFPYVLSERIKRRFASVKSIFPDLDPLKIDIDRFLFENKFQQSLLHMDLRDSNLLVKDGKLRAVIDWTNALVGDRNLEIVRLIEMTSMEETLRTDLENRFLSQCDPMLLLIYKLDVLLMMTILFSLEIPDKRLSKIYFHKLLSTVIQLHKV
ncbi:aminoglycoside phosphotransferase family protein [Leptospira sp. 201903071]|uniref:phosphotransferase family protein n=1 Tax=Leptospira ainazelensis TaxID=2810034 RepID=UPI0019640A8D|nr:aminoglycoside phosphotransferase family protein [Leptospira ainazelensis]MBM9502383.1 aminoglycoside phosphotransferase family protein [Leptospira ainazelensis]